MPSGKKDKGLYKVRLAGARLADHVHMSVEVAGVDDEIVILVSDHGVLLLVVRALNDAVGRQILLSDTLCRTECLSQRHFSGGERPAGE